MDGIRLMVSVTMVDGTIRSIVCCDDVFTDADNNLCVTLGDSYIAEIESEQWTGYKVAKYIT